MIKSFDIIRLPSGSYVFHPIDEYGIPVRIMSNADLYTDDYRDNVFSAAAFYESNGYDVDPCLYGDECIDPWD